MRIDYKDKERGEKFFLVSWTMSNKCNYSCSYCPDMLHNGTTGHPKWESVKHFITSLSLPERNICYRISGGEPTTWKYFTDMAKLVKDQGHTFTFLTNGFRKIEYFEEISRHSDGILLSYHPEYATPEHFAAIARNSHCPVAVQLMLVPEQFDQLCEIARQIYEGDTNVAIWPKVILDKQTFSNEMYAYTQDQLDFIANWPYYRAIDDYYLDRGAITLDNEEIKMNQVITRGLNRHKGWECWAGLHMLHIDMWGRVYRANCKEGGVLGTIGDFKLPKSTITCGKDVCACLSDIALRKQST